MPTTSRPDDFEVLSRSPWSGRWEQVRLEGSKAVAGLIRRLGLDRVCLEVGNYYSEVVGPDELPTDDLLWAWRRDLEAHGKIVVTLYHDPENRDFFDLERVEQVCIVAREDEDRIVLEDRTVLDVIRFGNEALRHSQRLSRQVAGP